MTGFELLGNFILLALWCVVVYFIFHHAKENGYSPWLWALVVFMFGVLGLIAYGIRNIV